MNVETFEVEELLADGSTEDQEKAKDLTSSLALEGQKKFFESKDRFPYRKMTRQEAQVYGLICPSRTALSKYEDSPIPLRVLQVAAHAKGLGFFDELVVMHPASAVQDDPLLVGRKGTEWSGEFYILARWGNILLPFQELMQRAKEIAIAQAKVGFAKVRAQLESDAQAIEEQAEAYVQGERARITPHYSII